MSQYLQFYMVAGSDKCNFGLMTQHLSLYYLRLGLYSVSRNPVVSPQRHTHSLSLGTQQQHAYTDFRTRKKFTLVFTESVDV